MMQNQEQMFKMISLEEVEFVDAAMRLKEGASQIDEKVKAAMKTVIDANQMRYDKERKFLEANGNIVVTNQIENMRFI